jgi:hypothetical protein
MVVDHRDIGRRQAGRRRGGEMHDRLHLARGQGGARGEVDQDRCGRRGLIADGEIALLGHHQVHLGRLHSLDRLDGLLELSLQRLLVLDLLHELRRRDTALLQVREADGSRTGQSLFGQGDPLLVHVRGRHQDGGAAVAQLVGDFGRRQLRRHGPGVRGLEIGEEGLIVGLRLEVHELRAADDQTDDRQPDHDFLTRGEPGERRTGASPGGVEGVAVEGEEGHRATPACP